MNEILVHKWTKKIITYGIHKQMARAIAITAIEASKGKNIELYVHYAVDLTFGLGFSKKFAK